MRKPSQTLPRTTERRAFPGHFFHPRPLFLMCVCVCPACFSHPTPLSSVLLQCLALFCLSPGVKILALSNYWLCHGQRGCGLKLRDVVSSCTHTKKRSVRAAPQTPFSDLGRGNLQTPLVWPADTLQGKAQYGWEGICPLGGTLFTADSKNDSLTGFSYSY